MRCILREDGQNGELKGVNQQYLDLTWLYKIPERFQNSISESKIGHTMCAHDEIEYSSLGSMTSPSLY